MSTSPQHSDKLYFLEPVKIGIHIKFLHRLFLFRCPFPCLQTQILQCFSQLVFLGQPQDVIIQLQGVKHPEINAYCHRRGTFSMRDTVSGEQVARSTI